MSDPSDDRFRPDFIEAARHGLEPTAADRARLRRSIAAQIVGIATVTATAAGASGASAAGGAAVGGAAVAASAAGSSLLLKVLVGTLALSAVVALGTVVVRDRQGDASADAGAPVATANAAAAPAVAPEGPPATPETRDPSTVPSSVVAPPAPSALAAHPASALPGGPRVADPAAATEGELSVETRLLSSAAGALRGGDPRGALTLLDEHRRRFPRGVLSEERDAERVFALCAMGSEEEARRSAKQFAREHPRSGLAPRVARACSGR